MEMPEMMRLELRLMVQRVLEVQPLPLPAMEVTAGKAATGEEEVIQTL
jgi:hypothetical protein